jgi:hypothetical protein
VHTIQPPAPLPIINNSLTLDGYSQSGATRNTSADADNANLKIVLDGSFLPSGSDGLNISAGNVTVTGPIINQCPHWGINTASCWSAASTACRTTLSTTTTPA